MPTRRTDPKRLNSVGPRSSQSRRRTRQNAKIGQIGHALATAGLFSLDEQAEAVGLSRSTMWTLLRVKHHGSGLSPRIIARMLAAPDLPRPVRAKILEYVAEKRAGQYGDSDFKLRRFVRRLAHYRISVGSGSRAH